MIANQLGKTVTRYFTQYVEQIHIPQISLEEQQPFELLVEYILWLKAHEHLLESASDKVMARYFEVVIDSAVFELYFEAQMKEAEKDILQFLGNLPTIAGKTDAEALDTVRKIYATLSHRDHPVAQRTYYVNSVPVVRVIKGLSIPSNVKIL